LSKRERQRLVFLPDPAPDHVLPPQAQARESLGIPPLAKVVLIYGALSERKGVMALIESASSAECPQNIYVVLAGKQSPPISAFLHGSAAAALLVQKRLKIMNAYIPDAEEARLLAVTDCMWVGYRGFYTMSAILVLAARHGIPCIVSEEGIAGYLMRKNEFGWIVNPEKQETVVVALKQVAGISGDLAAKGQRGVSALSRHSITEFQRVMSRMIGSTSPNREWRAQRG
jgi:glycosyltransferase involved in cell wall biosynthesis